MEAGRIKYPLGHTASFLLALLKKVAKEVQSL